MSKYERYDSVIEALSNGYNELPWYKRLFFPSSIKRALDRYVGGNKNQEVTEEICRAYLNNTWFFQRWFFCLIQFSNSSLLNDYNKNKLISGTSDAEAGQSNNVVENDTDNNDEQQFADSMIKSLPPELVNIIVGYLPPEDARSFALSSKTNFFKAEFNLIEKKAQYLATLVAQGKQVEAERLLNGSSTENINALLRKRTEFTDYSGRTFHCTAYEYAYWAKDTHMCRMLESHMDEETKAIMAARIDEIERIDAAAGHPVGLVYSQAGQAHRSAHFDFTPLKEAYQRYFDGFNDWELAGNMAAMDAAWLNVGKAQRNVPAHVAQEFCQPDRRFFPIPEFNEAKLLRVLTIYHRAPSRESWFPLTSSNAGLGFDFAVLCGGTLDWVNNRPRWGGEGAARVAVSPVLADHGYRTARFGGSYPPR